MAAALAHLERFGSTTRVRRDGHRMHPDTNGLTIGVFRQTTSRADDPQLHTHAVISAKVQTAEGRWLALDARYLKRHQRMLGGIYQSVLRAELTARRGVAWGPIINGQAELAGVPTELIDLFSKRSAQIDVVVAAKVKAFRRAHGREPNPRERAALSREAAADTRCRKSGTGAEDLRTRWRAEAAPLGWSPGAITGAALGPRVADPDRLTAQQVIDLLSTNGSTWTRADVLRAICDLHPPVPGVDGHRWASWLEHAADRILDSCLDLDPGDAVARRLSDGRSVWLHPTSPSYTSEQVLADEELVLSWAIDAQLADPGPSTTVDVDGLDLVQAELAAAVAGVDRLVVGVGPAGAGKTRTLAAAAADLDARGRRVFGVAPSAKAAQVLAHDTGITTDTVHKLVHEHRRRDRPPRPEYRLPPGTTLLVDEAGMLAISMFAQLVTLADQHHWRLVLIGDHHQLQAVGRGGLFAELVASSRTHQLEHLHRFSHPWEAAATLLLRAGDPSAVSHYLAHDRITAGTIDDHTRSITQTWLDATASGRTIAIAASTNREAQHLNVAIQHARLLDGQIDGYRSVPIAERTIAFPGDRVMTRRNDRNLTTTSGQHVRNRDVWTVSEIHPEGALTVTHPHRGRLTLPADYVADHVQLGYASTEHGVQGETVDVGIELVTDNTSRRGLYVGATRGRDHNQLHVVTSSREGALAEARQILERVLTTDRSDVPATTQRRALAQHQLAAQQAVTATANPTTPTPPRRPLPSWFDDLHRHLGRELSRARGDLTRTRLHDQQQADALREADQRHEEARAAHEPWAARLRRSTTELRRLHGEVDRLTRAFANEPRRHRRALRRALDAATQQLAAHADRHQQLQRESDPTRSELDLAGRRQERLRRAQLVSTGDRDRCGARAQHLEHLVRALDIWRQWADGHDVDPTALVHARGMIETHLPNRSRAAELLGSTAPAPLSRPIRSVGGLGL